jgi:hypothetical protein
MHRDDESVMCGLTDLALPSRFLGMHTSDPPPEPEEERPDDGYSQGFTLWARTKGGVEGAAPAFAQRRTVA